MTVQNRRKMACRTELKSFICSSENANLKESNGGFKDTHKDA